MRKVVVLGSINMDVSIESDRMPLEGETLSGDNLLINAGGKGANQAVASARAGVHTHLIGCVGTDSFGKELRASLAQSGVDIQEVTTATSTTGMAIVLRSHGNNRIIINHGANEFVTPEFARAALSRIAQPHDIFLTQFESPVQAVESSIEFAHAHDMITVVNPSPVRSIKPSLYKSIDILCLNETECMSLFDINPTMDAPTMCALTKVLQLGMKTLVVTLGAAGCLLVSNKHQLFAPAYAVKALDSTGAGDTFVGAMSACLAKGAHTEQAIAFAQAAAALSTTRVGAQVSIPTCEEVEAFQIQHKVNKPISCV